jgi:hypothetical protein
MIPSKMESMGNPAIIMSSRHPAIQKRMSELDYFLVNNHDQLRVT